MPTYSLIMTGLNQMIWMIQEQLNTFGAKYKVCADHEFLLFTISFF